MLIRAPFGQFLEGHSKSLQSMLIRAPSGYQKDIARASKMCSSGYFWAVFGKAQQEITQYAYQGTFWAVFEGYGKIVLITLIRAPFGQFLEGDGKLVSSTLIRAPFGQFLEGHGKGSQSIVIRAHFSIRSKSEQLLLFGKIFSTDRKKFFR